MKRRGSRYGNSGACRCWKRLKRGWTRKRVAIGRKNWLFAGTDAAAANHARLWSLIASAERHGLDPQRYLSSVLAKLGQLPRDTGGHIPAAELAQFLPDVWKRDDAADPLPAVQ